MPKCSVAECDVLPIETLLIEGKYSKEKGEFHYCLWHIESYKKRVQKDLSDYHYHWITIKTIPTLKKVV